MLTADADRVKKMKFSEMSEVDLKILVQIHSDLFSEPYSVAHPITGEVSEKIGIIWKKCSREYVYETLRKNRKIKRDKLMEV